MTNYFFKFKFIFYFISIFIIILYLLPGSTIDKILLNNDNHVQTKHYSIISKDHFFIFFFLSVVGFFTFIKSNSINVLIICLMIFSIILELFHFIIPGRLFEFSDILGNLFGIFMLKVIEYIFLKYEKNKN